MDTKLKNRHKLGIFLVWLVIIGSAVLMLCFYPGIVKDKNRQKNSSGTMYWRDQVENTCSQMIHWPYVLWMNEMEEKAGKALTPSQVFAPELLEWMNSDKEEADTIVSDMQMEGTESVDETGNISDNIEETIEEGIEESVEAAEGSVSNLEDIEVTEEQITQNRDEERFRYVREDLDSLVRGWQTNFRQWNEQVQYLIVDENKKTIDDNNVLLSARDWLTVQMHYDHKGKLDGINIKASKEDWLKENKEETVKIMEAYLTDFYYREPLEERFEEEMDGSGLHFMGPSDRTYTFVIPAQAIFDIEAENNSYWYMQNSMFLFSLLWVAFAVAIAAFVLQGIPSLHLGSGKISHVPMEIVVVILGFLMPFGYIYGALLLGVLESGQLADSIELLMGISSVDAQTFAFGFYLVYWILVFAIGYWCIHCLSAFVWIRPGRYLRERTLIGLFGGYVASAWRRLYTGFCSVDLEKKPTKMILKAVLLNFVVLAVISCFWMFGVLILILYSIGLFFLLMKYWGNLQKKYDILLQSVKQMADGKLDTEIVEDLGVFEPLKKELEKVQQGFKTAVEEETKSQRMKTELITNVSHDLKTPLTAIVTYVNLLKKEDITQEERENYIEILDKKSMRLKTLIEDLFEVSKAASRTVQLNLVEVDIVSLLKQVRLELSDRLDASGVEFRWELPQEKVVLMLDSEKTYRIFENLLVNIAKYGMPKTRAYIEVHQEIVEEREIKADTMENTEIPIGAAPQYEKPTGKRRGKAILQSVFARSSSSKSLGSTSLEENGSILPNDANEKEKKELSLADDFGDQKEEMLKEEALKEEALKKETLKKETLKKETLKEMQYLVKKHVWISMKNISLTEISAKPEELAERFVRGDESRNTEGSGLGLAIAKNFVEAQGGEMKIEVEADLFKILIDFGVCEQIIQKRCSKGA